ncbi:hypothetical protein BDW69DRAFT_172048 [Aspergillus filifer]
MDLSSSSLSLFVTILRAAWSTQRRLLSAYQNKRLTAASTRTNKWSIPSVWPETMMSVHNVYRDRPSLVPGMQMIQLCLLLEI